MRIDEEDAMAFGQPIAYTALQLETPVLDTDGIELGRVQHVLQDDGLDLFDGVVISTNRELRFLDAAQITGIYTGAVLTTLSKDMIGTLSEPDGAPVHTVDFLLETNDSPTARLGRLFRHEHWKTTHRPAARSASSLRGKQGVRTTGSSTYGFVNEIGGPVARHPFENRQPGVLSARNGERSRTEAAHRDRRQNQAKFVEFRTIGHGQVSVLVTAVIGVRFEEKEHTPDEVDQMEQVPPTIDFGYDFD